MKRPTHARLSLVAVITTLCAVACDDATMDTSGTGGASSSVASGSGVSTSSTAGSTSTVSSSTDGSASASSSSGGALPTCKGYPVELTMPDTQAAAQAELQSFAPQASLQWSAVHGTMSNVTGLGQPLDCSTDVWSAAWQILSAHPALFQLAESEWVKPPPFACGAITSDQIVNTYRAELAGLGVQKDVLALVLGPLPNGGVELRGVSGFYLPVLAKGDLEACPNLDDATITPILRAGPFAYSTFQTCVPTGSGTYTPKPNDVLALGPETWSWEDGTGTIVARKLRTATLTIDESNWTPELMASDANCPKGFSDERVLGFVLTFDPVTGEILDVKPGIGCIVC